VLHPMKLQEKYPKMYGNLRMGRFECGEGWYDILDWVGEKVEPLLEESSTVIVKEKFGLLEIQGFNFGDEARKYIQEAREKSSEVCENCGNPAERSRVNNWIVTRCPPCKKALEFDLNEAKEFVKNISDDTGVKHVFCSIARALNEGRSSGKHPGATPYEVRLLDRWIGGLDDIHTKDDPETIYITYNGHKGWVAWQGFPEGWVAGGI